MKAILDHVGIAVQDIEKAIAFYREALGLEVDAPEEVATERVRARIRFQSAGRRSNCSKRPPRIPPSPHTSANGARASTT